MSEHIQKRFTASGGRRPLHVHALLTEFGHRPLRRRLDLLEHNCVRGLVLSGHQHSYERTCAAYGGRCLPPGSAGGTVFIVAGTGGAGLYKYPPGTSPTGNYTVEATSRWGYLRVAANASRLRVAFVDNLSGGERMRWCSAPGNEVTLQSLRTEGVKTRREGPEREREKAQLFFLLHVELRL